MRIHLFLPPVDVKSVRKTETKRIVNEVVRTDKRKGYYVDVRV